MTKVIYHSKTLGAEIMIMLLLQHLHNYSISSLHMLLICPVIHVVCVSWSEGSSISPLAKTPELISWQRQLWLWASAVQWWECTGTKRDRGRERGENVEWIGRMSIQLWIAKVRACWQKEVDTDETESVPPPKCLPLETTWEWFQRPGLSSLGGYAVFSLPGAISKILCVLCWVLWDEWAQILVLNQPQKRKSFWICRLR